MANDLMRRALAAYYRSGANQQPSTTASGITTHNGLDYIVLRNINGVLAVYRVQNSGRLKGLRRWPKALEQW